MRISVPAKLIVAGEYAVLEQGQPGIGVAIDQPLTAIIAPAPRSQVSIPALHLKGLDPADGLLLEKSPFVAQAISRTAHYLESRGIQPMPFHLILEGSAQKRGLGGSAQSTVATTAALLAYCGCFERRLLYRLSALTHAHVQGSGSGLDVATIVFGGWISYTSPGQDRLVTGDLEADWGPLAIDPLKVPWPLLIGWTGQPASTPAFVRMMSEHDLTAFGQQSRDAVEALAFALVAGDFEQARAAMAQARQGLQQLGASSGLAIETPLLAQLADIAENCGGMGKLSGAGGGDCGIALVNQAEQTACIRAAWRQAGIEPLDLTDDHAGTRLVAK